MMTNPGTERDDFMDKSYRLKDLDCANCAMKIGKAVSNLPTVNKAEVQFASQRLNVAFAGMPTADDEASILSIVKGLEPEVEVLPWQEQSAASVMEEHQEKLRSFRRDWIILAIAVVLAAAGLLIKGVWPLGETLFMAVAYAVSGYDILKTAVKRLLQKKPLDETLLMSIATIGAWVLGDGFEAVAVMVFYRVGETLQEMAVHRGRADIRALSTLVSDEAHVVLREVVDMPIAAVHPGDVLEVRTGERIPTDGLVIKGETALDTSALTGESMPVSVSPGDEILSGSMNTGPMIHMRATAPASDSAVSRILHMTQEEAAKKAAPERFLSKFAAIYTPAVVALAALIFVIPPLVGLGTFSQWGYRALLLLVISCPCALVLSVPLSYVAGMGKSARQGLLVKGGNVLEALAKVDAIAMDKTGTLTKGTFQVLSMTPAPGIPRDRLLEGTLLCESKSQHPLAKSIMDWPESALWRKDHTLGDEYAHYEEIPGKGVAATINGKTLLCGGLSLMEKEGIKVPEAHRSHSVHTAEDGVYLGSFTLSDTLREETPKVLASLKALGIKDITVLTGDSREGTKTLEGLDGVGTIRHGLLPKDKADHVKAMEAAGGHVAFVGDGINDAPVLAAAEVGIAVGGVGSQAAMEAGDAVLAAGTLSALPKAIVTARRTARIVRINVTLALVIKLAVMVLGIAGLANMWMAIFADVGVSLLCVLLAGSLRIGK